jgi:hypothetical protein
MHRYALPDIDAAAGRVAHPTDKKKPALRIRKAGEIKHSDLFQ